MDSADLIIKLSDDLNIPLNHAVLIVLCLIVKEKIDEDNR